MSETSLKLKILEPKTLRVETVNSRKLRLGKNRPRPDSPLCAKITSDIAIRGILSPLTVVEHVKGRSHTFEVIDGNVRLRAARASGITAIPITVIRIIKYA